MSFAVKRHSEALNSQVYDNGFRETHTRQLKVWVGGWGGKQRVTSKGTRNAGIANGIFQIHLEKIPSQEVDWTKTGPWFYAMTATTNWECRSQVTIVKI